MYRSHFGIMFRLVSSRVFDSSFCDLSLLHKCIKPPYGGLVVRTFLRQLPTCAGHQIYTLGAQVEGVWNIMDSCRVNAITYDIYIYIYICFLARVVVRIFYALHQCLFGDTLGWRDLGREQCFCLAWATAGDTCESRVTDIFGP